MAVEPIPPTVAERIRKLMRRIEELERRLATGGGDAGVAATDFECVNMGSWPFDVPAPELILGSVAVPATSGPVDQGGCSPTRSLDAVTFNATVGIAGYLPVFGTAG